MTGLRSATLLITDVLAFNIHGAGFTATGGVEITFRDSSSNCIIGPGSQLDNLVILPRPPTGHLICLIEGTGWRASLMRALARQVWTVTPKQAKP